MLPESNYDTTFRGSMKLRRTLTTVTQKYYEYPAVPEELPNYSTM